MIAFALPGFRSFAQLNFIKHPIDENFDGAWAAYRVDLDRDNDMDILASASDGYDIAWYENDGSQVFTKHIIDDNFVFAEYLFAIDLDGDEDIDFVAGSSSYPAGGIFGDLAWYENDGSQNFTKRIIDANRNGTNSVFAIDLDGDSDIDIVSHESEIDDLLWYENDGNHNFTRHLIDGNFDNVFYVYAIDLDRDTDVDVLAAATDAGQLAWWENDGSENFTKHIIAAGFAGSAYVDVKDVDRDNDWDVMGAAFFGHEVAWFENDGSQNFTKRLIDGNFTGAASFDAADLDGDSDLDFLGSAFDANDVAWWENTGPTGITDTNALLPGDFRLFQNYPNPFNPSTIIRYSLPHPSNVELTIFNSLGQEIRVLLKERQSPGIHQVQWDGKNQLLKPMPGGVYLYRLSAGSFTGTGKMILLK